MAWFGLQTEHEGCDSVIIFITAAIHLSIDLYYGLGIYKIMTLAALNSIYVFKSLAQSFNSVLISSSFTSTLR